jgi:hypothetical protein
MNGQPIDSTQALSPLSSSGIANFTLVNLPRGVYNISAVYNGDQNFASQTIALPEIEVIVPSLQITASPATASITPGTPVLVTLTLMPLLNFTDNVSLKCLTNTLPEYSECTFAYPNTGQGVVSVSGTTPSTIVVTISSNVPVNGGTASIERHVPWALAGLLGLGLLGLKARRKKLNSYLTLICAVLVLSGVSLGIAACTNAGYSTPPPAPNVVTPAGSYAVQIISFDPTTEEQNSLTAPLFTLPTTVQ